MVEIWIDGYDYKMEIGADGQQWLHCPKQNRREKSWLTSEEVERHFHAMKMLQEKMDKKVKEEEQEAAHQQHLAEIAEYERQQQEKKERYEKQQQQKGKGKKTSKDKSWVKKEAVKDQTEENTWEKDGDGWEEAQPATHYPGDYMDAKDEKEKKSDKPSRPNTPPGLLGHGSDKDSGKGSDKDMKSANSAKMSTGSNKTTRSGQDDKEKVEFMGCTTWPEFRRLAAAEAQKASNKWEDKKVCFICPAKGCYWSSKHMDWNAAEYALTMHVTQQGENEEAYWQKPNPSMKDLEMVIHPGRKWMAQVSPRKETEEELLTRLRAAGIEAPMKKMKTKEEDTHWGSQSFEEWEAQWEQIDAEEGRPSGAASSTESWIKPQRKPGPKGSSKSSGKSNKGPKEPKEPPAHKKQKMKQEWNDRVKDWWKDWDRNRKQPYRRY